jgi:hypothetical protein
MQRFVKKLPYFICYLIAFVLAMKQLREPDVWWQLLSGRWMLEHGQVTHTDIFSYTMTGHKWVNVKWLYEVIIALLEKGFEPEVVLLLQGVVNVAILWALFQTLKQVKAKLQIEVSGFFTIVAALLFFATVEYRMTGRPEMVSHLMCALYIAYLWCCPELKWKQLIWPVALQCLWANMHEGYPVGIVIIGMYTAGSFIAYLLQKEKGYLQTAIRGAALTALAAIAVLLNPNGVQLWKQPFEIYRQVWANKYTTELYAYTDPGYWTVQAKVHVVLMALVILFWIVRLAQAYRQKDRRFYQPAMVSYLLLIPVFSYLSLTANRNIPFAEILYFPTIPYMMWWLGDVLKLHAKNWFVIVEKNSMILACGIGLLFYVTIVNNSYYKFTKSPNRYGIHISMLHNPTGAVDFIKQHQIKGRAFSDYFVSSYMLWALYPDFKSYIDLRDLDIFSEKFFDQYFSLYENPGLFKELDKKYNFDYVVLSTSQLSGVQHNLYWGEGFNQVYVDPVTVIYLKSNEGNSRINNNWALQQIYTWPQQAEDQSWASALNMLLNPALTYEKEDEIHAPVYSAKYYNEIGNYPLAIKQLQPAIYNLEDDADANFTLGNSYMHYASVINVEKEKKGKLDTAYMYIEKARELDPTMANVYAGLANLSLIAGDNKQAIAQLEKSISLDSKDAYIHFLLGLCYRAQWKQGVNKYREKMETSLENSIEINPANGRAYLYLAEIDLSKNKGKSAKENLLKALKSKEQFTEEEKKLSGELKAQLNMQ